MKKWEYLTVEFKRVKETGKVFAAHSFNCGHIDKALNSYGREGWELVSFFTETVYEGAAIAAFATMKREIV